MSRPGAIANPVLAGLALILGALWWWSVRSDRIAVRDSTERLRMARFNPDEIREVVLERPSVRTRVARDGTIWRLLEPVEAPADAVEVGRLLETLADVVSGTPIPAEELREAPPVEMGFDPPAARIALVRPGGDLTFECGQALPGGRLYVRLSPPNVFFAVNTNVLAAIPPSADALRDRTLFPGVSDIRQIRLRRPGGRIHLSRADDGQWRIMEPIQARADRQAAQRLVEALLTARVREFVRDEVALGDPYGLDESAIEVLVDAGPGVESRSLRIGRRSDTDPAGVYAQRGGSRAVVTVSAEIAWMCAASLDDLRDRRLVPIAPEDIAGWSLERGNRRLHLVTTNGGWTILEPTPAPADDARVRAFIREWLGTRIESFPSNPALPAPAVRLCWYRTAAGESAAVTGMPAAVTLLVAETPLEWTPVAVIEGGSTNIVMIRTKPPGALAPDPLRFRTRVLLSLPRERIAGFVLRRGNVEQRVTISTNGVLTERGDPVPVATVLPKLRALDLLQAVNLVTDSPAELISYGLDPPAASLTVLDRADSGGSVTLLFGRSGPEGTFVRIQGRDLVALLDPATAGALQADLVPTPTPPPGAAPGP
ncbi:MAG: DUF4340 domain-containing protein [Kiritimatiellae bacterium]|nr:DUF4340 domain-containing protein [Kiritimatiellia bacterium]